MLPGKTCSSTVQELQNFGTILSLIFTCQTEPKSKTEQKLHIFN